MLAEVNGKITASAAVGASPKIGGWCCTLTLLEERYHADGRIEGWSRQSNGTLRGHSEGIPELKQARKVPKLRSLRFETAVIASSPSRQSSVYRRGFSIDLSRSFSRFSCSRRIVSFAAASVSRTGLASVRSKWTAAVTATFPLLSLVIVEPSMGLLLCRNGSMVSFMRPPAHHEGMRHPNGSP